MDDRPVGLLTIVADPGATMTFIAGGALKPIGGHVLSHASATRLFLRKGGHILSLGLTFARRLQDGRRNGSLSWWTAPTVPRTKPLTNLMKVGGRMFEGE